MVDINMVYLELSINGKENKNFIQGYFYIPVF